LIHRRWAINAFAPIEFCDPDGDLLTCFFNPGLVFGIKTSKQLQGNRQDFFCVGVTLTI
jgi:hypothetical protein